MKRHRHYDWAVVGGGIAGLYCCLHAPAGKSVVLFEATGRVSLSGVATWTPPTTTAPESTATWTCLWPLPNR